jgi:hypothetical protein
MSGRELDRDSMPVSKAAGTAETVDDGLNCPKSLQIGDS